MLIMQQARHRTYDGIGVLGYSAVHTHPPAKPGAPPIVLPWYSRDDKVVLNADIVARQATERDSQAMAWGFHYLEEMDPAVVAADMRRYAYDPDNPGRYSDPSPPPWASLTYPEGSSVVTPGAVASEAAAIRVPVLSAMGERDVIADPRGETRAYLSANSVDLFICPRMAHMHNFASTRELFWRRIETWAAWVREAKAGLD